MKKRAKKKARIPLLRFNHIWIDFFGGMNFYWIRSDRKDYAALFKRNFGVEAPKKEDTIGATFEIGQKDGQPVGCIWLKPGTLIPQMAHECFHAAHWLCADRGIWLTDSSEEIYAYLIEKMVQNIVTHEKGKK